MGPNWSQLLQGFVEKFAYRGQHCMNRCAWGSYWLRRMCQYRAGWSQAGAHSTPLARAADRDIAHTFSLHPNIMLPQKDREPILPTQSLLVQKKSSSSYGILETWLRVSLGNQHHVSLCTRAVDWLKSHSIGFNVALEYSFIMNWFCLRSCLRCIFCFLEYKIQHFKGVSVRKDDASRGQCITVLNLFYLTC